MRDTLLEPLTAKHAKKIRKERKEMPTTGFPINVFMHESFFTVSTKLNRPSFAIFAASLRDLRD